MQISQWRTVKRDGVRLLDTTAKSGIKAFAPDFIDVMEYKKGNMSEEDYTYRYLEKMEDSRYHNKDMWDRLSAYPYVAYACYCPKGVFCHRKLFAPLAKDHLESMGWTPVLKGEYTGDLGDLVIPERFKNILSESPHENQREDQDS